MKKKVVKTKIYSVDWYHGDHCYCTTMGCTWEDVKECRRRAKLMGETIEYEHYDTREDVYVLCNLKRL
jgi:hypothetical protein